MNASHPVLMPGADPDFNHYLHLLTDTQRARRLHFNLRYLLAYLPEPDYRSGMPPEYPPELMDDIRILLQMLDMAAQTCPEENSCAQPAGSDSAFDALVRFLVESIRPEKIFLLPHPPPTGPAAPFTELIVIMPDATQKSFSSIEQVIDIGCIHHHQVHTTLLASSDLNKRIVDGDLYYSTVCTHRQMVYDNGRIPLPQAPPEKLRAACERARKVFEAGHDRAAGFLEAARHQTQTGLTTFMLQQAAELSFRTVAMALTGFDPRSHAFEVLKKHCRRCAPELNTILPGTSEEEARLLHILESAYLNARYKDNFLIDAGDLLILRERVEYLHRRSAEIFDYQMSRLFATACGSAY